MCLNFQPSFQPNLTEPRFYIFSRRVTVFVTIYTWGIMLGLLGTFIFETKSDISSISCTNLWVVLHEVAHAVLLEIKALEVDVLVDDVRVALLLRVLGSRPGIRSESCLWLVSCKFTHTKSTTPVYYLRELAKTSLAPESISAWLMRPGTLPLDRITAPVVVGRRAEIIQYSIV